MLSTLLTWLLIYGITSVLGAGVIHLVQPRQLLVTAQTEVVLIGLVSVVAFLQAASIVLPADYWLTVALVLAAVCINWRLNNQPIHTAVNRLRQMSRRPINWLLGAVLLVYSTYRSTNIDSGMYHLPSIRWYERYPAIPGLGNLHGRLAFNSSFFVASAAFGFTDVVGQTLVALNGFMLLLFGLYVLRSIEKKELTPHLKVLHVLLLGLVLYYLIRQVSSPTPDVWGTILPLFVFLLWLDDSPGPVTNRLLLLMALLFTGLTIKLATVPMLLFVPFIAYKNRRDLRMAHIWGVVALGFVLIGPWVIRNGILSGYLIYPLPTLDVLPVDWKIPLANVRLEQDIVTFCARFRVFESYLDPSMLNWPTSRWVRWWLRTREFYWLSRPLFGLAVLSPLLLGILWVRDRPQLRRLLPVYSVALAGFVFWFFKAPEFRFGYPFVWLVAVLPAAFLLVISYRDEATRADQYEPHRTRSGLVVLVPTPVPYQQSCFDIEQLCSPYFFNDLEMRGATIEAGFRRRSMLQTHSLPHTLYPHEIKHHYSRF